MNGITCNVTVTLIHHTASIDTDTYACHVVEGVSWYEKKQVSTSADGARPTSSVVIRIPENRLPGLVPEIGDYIAYGEVDNIVRPADLRNTRYFKVNSVSDNRVNRLLPHIRVSGS